MIYLNNELGRLRYLFIVESFGAAAAMVAAILFWYVVNLLSIHLFNRGRL